MSDRSEAAIEQEATVDVRKIDRSEFNEMVEDVLGFIGRKEAEAEQSGVDQITVRLSAEVEIDE